MTMGVTPWRPIETAPEGIVVMTKISDARGVRNEQALIRKGNLWFIPDCAMYVYYTPTHWAPKSHWAPAARQGA